VVAQMALAVMLVAAGALMLRSMQQLLHVQPGFDAKSVLTFQLPMPHTTADQIPARLRELDELQSRFANVAGVRSAAYAVFLPLDGNNVNSDFQIGGRPYVNPTQAPVAEQRWVGPGFFETLGIRLLRGRDFALSDSSSAPKVAIINRAMAEHFWPEADPIGEHVGFTNIDQKTEWSEIVGVVDDVHDFGLSAKVRWEVYAPMAQAWPLLWTGSQNPVVSFAVNSAGDAAALTPAITAELHRVDAAQPVNNVRLLQTSVRESLASPRFGTTLLGLFAALGLVIALCGIYSVLTWAVTQRTAEIGIRVAIGATRQNILNLVLREALTLLGISLVIGVAGALAVGRMMRSMLFETSPTNPLILAIVALLVSVVAIAASYLPARRATNVDPMIALRCE
jgi:putative ABC transport system permease protein